MPKQKTRKTILKRFKITASGKVLRGHQYGRHRRSHKTKRRIRSFKEPVQLPTKQARIVKLMINKMK
ncbi:50S ribosomal protein L35 [Candidatus Gottesmanbacteria bacterium]|nr:50S ribosomal protein L35 [Candidatus Gottesmanbacteria bacterium]